MDAREIFRRVDYTLLSPTATWPQAQAACDRAAELGAASVCLSPQFVAPAVEHVAGRVSVCTVVGFPSGCHATAVKEYEARCALDEGAAEIDMVLSLGLVKAGDWLAVHREVEGLKSVCGTRILKVIVEACLLTREEKITLCRLLGEAGADFIKTSTGFSTGGAALEDVALFREHRADGLRIKAAGGIRTLARAEEFLSAGADRIGTSGLGG